MHRRHSAGMTHVLTAICLFSQTTLYLWNEPCRGEEISSIASVGTIRSVIDVTGHKQYNCSIYIDNNGPEKPFDLYIIPEGEFDNKFVRYGKVAIKWICRKGEEKTVCNMKWGGHLDGILKVSISPTSELYAPIYEHMNSNTHNPFKNGNRKKDCDYDDVPTIQSRRDGFNPFGGDPIKLPHLIVVFDGFELSK